MTYPYPRNLTFCNYGEQCYFRKMKGYHRASNSGWVSKWNYYYPICLFKDRCNQQRNEPPKKFMVKR